MLSRIVIGLLLETDESRFHNLYINLKQIISVDGVDTDLPESEANCIVHLHITFTKGTGDLEIEVPNISD